MSKTILPVLIALMTMTACAAQADDHHRSVTATQTVLQKMAPTSKITCKDDGYGQAACEADGVEVDLLGCGDGGLYGVTSGKGGVDLNQSIHGKGPVLAHVADRQFVCVAAIEKNSDAPNYYVIAIPTASVPECKGSGLCEGADHPVQLKRATTGKSCKADGNGEYTGDCAAGWVRESELDQYANGI